MPIRPKMNRQRNNGENEPTEDHDQQPQSDDEEAAQEGDPKRQALERFIHYREVSAMSREDYRIEKLVVVAAVTPKVIMRSIAQQVTMEVCQNTVQYVRESSKNQWSQSASITFAIHVLFGITLQTAIASYVVQTLKGPLMQHLI